ncbi:MAG: zinc ribbon-containing protein [Actinomycetota bacterium]
MARAGRKPGQGRYVCSRCGTAQELRTRGSTLKRCPNCRGSLFSKTKPWK